MSTPRPVSIFALVVGSVAIVRIQRCATTSRFLQASRFSEVATCQAAWQGCDTLVGFSQGAILAAILLHRNLLNPAPKAAVFFGAAVPGPFQGLELSCSVPCLHISSIQDQVNPIEEARKLHKALGGEMLLHDEGHAIPACTLPAVRAFLESPQSGNIIQ